MRQAKAETMAARLRRAGFRVTGPRLAILAELERNRTHPGAWELHRALKGTLPSLSVSTVYLTLEAFATKGLVRRLPARDGRLRVDGTVEAHDHAVCRGCGEIYDMPAQPAAEHPAPAGLPRGVRILGAHVEYEVLCARCQAGRGARRPATRRAKTRDAPPRHARMTKEITRWHS